jgi:beta-glucosidase
VTFHLPVNQMAFYDEDLKLILEPGKMLVLVGASSDDIRLNGEFEITGTGKAAVKERVFVCPVDIG